MTRERNSGQATSVTAGDRVREMLPAIERNATVNGFFCVFCWGAFLAQRAGGETRPAWPETALAMSLLAAVLFTVEFALDVSAVRRGHRALKRAEKRGHRGL